MGGILHLPVFLRESSVLYLLEEVVAALAVGEETLFQLAVQVETAEMG
jgi:hypothetical protein